MKKELRRRIRLLKQNREFAENRACWSAQICQQLLCHPRVADAQTLLLYHPLPDEVDVTPVIAELHRQGKTILLPKVISDTEMQLRRYDGIESLQSGAFGILEPTGPVVSPDVLCSASAVAIVPGMAFDAVGNRLGRGKGYYDRLLAVLASARQRPWLIGVCFCVQMVESVPHDEHDVPVNEIIHD